MRNPKNAALLIGISNPPLQEGPAPLRFAGADADSLAKLYEGEFGPDSVFSLKDREATTAAVSACLEALANSAQSGGKLVIFISARGFWSSQMDDGFLLTYDSAIDKLPAKSKQQIGNGISMRMLSDKLRQIPAVEKVLLLDLCRDPPESPTMENFINKKILNETSLSKLTHFIVLASTGSQRSLEPRNSIGKNGYYAGALIRFLPGDRLLPDLFERIKSNIKNDTDNRQVPYRLPSSPGDSKECPLCKVAWRAITGPLFASLEPMIVAQDAPPAPPQQDLQVLGEAARYEQEGQRTFIRYGEGNHFSGDPFHECDHPLANFAPFRLCREEYLAAAANFREAARLRRTITGIHPETNRMAIESLDERERFCNAQVLMFQENWPGAVDELHKTPDFQFAESYNLLGIAYLEQADYPGAESQFEKAILRAPHWAYPRHNLALAYVEHGNYNAAETEYREAIRLTPVAEAVTADVDNPCFHGHSIMVGARPYLYYNLGVLLQRLNRLPEAKQQYCLADASFQMEQTQVGSVGPQGNADEQLTGLRAIAAAVNRVDVDNSLGVLFESLKKNKEARVQFQNAIRNNRANTIQNNRALSSALFNLARLDTDLAKKRKESLAVRQTYFLKVLDDPVCKTTPQELGCQAAKKELANIAATPSR
jgi:hypothetical protein